MIKRIFALCQPSTSLITKNTRFFAKPEKGQKPQKGGKPEEAKAPVVVQQATPEEIVRKYLATSQQGLSPNELQLMNEGFTDLSESERKMLDRFADEILDLQTPSYIEFIKRGGLGTSEALWVATKDVSDAELSESIKYLRKQ